MDNGTIVKEPKFLLETAEKEFKDWITSKYGNDQKYRDQEKDSVKMLLQAMADGLLILRGDGTASYKLRYPVMGEQSGKEVVHLKELNFKARLKYKEIKSLLKGIDAKDNMGMALAYTAGLTATPLRVLEELDMTDLTRVQLLMVFFVT